jgi:hypothetical protein
VRDRCDGGDEVKALFLKSLDLRALDHTAIANEGDLTTSKTLGEKVSVSCVFWEDFDGQRTPGTVAQ